MYKNGGRTDIIRRNVPLSLYKQRDLCGICGEECANFELVPQRDTMVNRNHLGCLDVPAYPKQVLQQPHIAE